jgi:hypothetical protein
MTYTKKTAFGNFEAELLEVQDLFQDRNEEGKLIREISIPFFNVLREEFITQGDLSSSLKKIKGSLGNFLTKEDFSKAEKLTKELTGLKKEFEELDKKKASKVNQEIKIFEKEFAILKKKGLEDLKEIETKIKSQKEELEKLPGELTKRLNSEILKKIPSNIKPEDLDTKKIIEGFYARTREKLKLKEAQTLIKEVEETIPKLNLLANVKLKILKSRDKCISVDEKKDEYSLSLREVFREILDVLNAGLEVKDVKTSSGKKGKEESEEEGDYYGN